MPCRAAPGPPSVRCVHALLVGEGAVVLPGPRLALAPALQVQRPAPAALPSHPAPPTLRLRSAWLPSVPSLAGFPVTSPKARHTFYIYANWCCESLSFPLSLLPPCLLRQPSPRPSRPLTFHTRAPAACRPGGRLHLSLLGHAVAGHPGGAVGHADHAGGRSARGQAPCGERAARGRPRQRSER